jgi:hypothetical protein
MGREVVEWIDVALDRGHVARCHEYNNAHLSFKNAGKFSALLGYRGILPRG